MKIFTRNSPNFINKDISKQYPKNSATYPIYKILRIFLHLLQLYTSFQQHERQLQLTFVQLFMQNLTIKCKLGKIKDKIQENITNCSDNEQTAKSQQNAHCKEISHAVWKCTIRRISSNLILGKQAVKQRCKEHLPCVFKPLVAYHGWSKNLCIKKATGELLVNIIIQNWRHKLKLDVLHNLQIRSPNIGFHYIVDRRYHNSDATQSQNIDYLSSKPYCCLINTPYVPFI